MTKPTHKNLRTSKVGFFIKKNLYYIDSWYGICHKVILTWAFLTVKKTEGYVYFGKKKFSEGIRFISAFNISNQMKESCSGPTWSYDTLCRMCPLFPSYNIAKENKRKKDGLVMNCYNIYDLLFVKYILQKSNRKNIRYIEPLFPSGISVRVALSFNF